MSWKGSSIRRPQNVEEGEIGEEEGEIVASPPSSSANTPQPPPRRFPPPPPPPPPPSDSRRGGMSGSSSFSFRALADNVPEQQASSSSLEPNSRRLPDHVFSSASSNPPTGGGRRSSSFTSFRDREFGGGRSGGGGDYRPGHRPPGGPQQQQQRRPSPPRRNTSFGRSSQNFGRNFGRGGASQNFNNRGGGDGPHSRNSSFVRSNSLTISSSGGGDDANRPDAGGGPSSRSGSFSGRPETVGRSASLGLNRNTSTDSTDHGMYGRGGNEEKRDGIIIKEGTTPPPPQPQPLRGGPRRFTSYGSLADASSLSGNRDYYGPAGGAADERGSSSTGGGPPRRSSWHPQRSPSDVRRKTSFTSPSGGVPPPPVHKEWSASTQQQQRPSFAKDESSRYRPNKEPDVPQQRSSLSSIPESSPAARLAFDDAAPLSDVVPTRSEKTDEGKSSHYIIRGRASPPPPPITSSQLLAGTPKKPTVAPTAASKQPVTPLPPDEKRPPEAKDKTQEKMKPEQPPPPPSPLTCASLGNPESVARAEKAVQLLNTLVSSSGTNKMATKGDSLLLPSKQLILKALAGIDAKIKKGQMEVERVQDELDSALATEAKEKEEKERLELERVRQEKRKRQEEESAEEDDMSMEDEDNEVMEMDAELQKEIDEMKKKRQESKRKALEELEERIAKLKQAEKERCKAETEQQVEHVSADLDIEIAAVQDELAKTQKAAAEAKAHASELEDEYRAKMEAVVPELAPESAPLPLTDLVATISAENKRRADMAQRQALDFFIPYYENVEESAGATQEEKIRNRSDEEWSNMARLVTGKENALYTEPSQNPYFEDHARTHAVIKPLVTEYVRNKKKRMEAHWAELAEEYVFRKEIYSKKVGNHHHKHHDHKSRSGGGGRSSIMGPKPRSNAFGGGRGGATAGATSRSSTNPYRRARRGNATTASGDIVRSDYEQQQIIDQINAQEAMERRITQGGSELPRQIGQVEKDLTATFVNTFSSHYVPDPLAETEEKQYVVNQWSDVEKCIFLDRFLQHPKDFRKIASFLRNKSAKDCVSFYYNSKQIVPYKRALKEHMSRRKRRADHPVPWDATIHAALSVGAIVEAGTSEDRPVTFTLPNDDLTFFTSKLHPMRLELFDAMNIHSSGVDDATSAEDMESKKRKRKFGTVCVLDKSECKFLKRSESEVSLPGMKRTSSSDADTSTPMSKTNSTADMSETAKKGDAAAPDKTGSSRKAPQKWTSQEKKLFAEAVKKYGKNWKLLESAVGTKSISQIKNYWYDCNKKQLMKQQRAGNQASGEAKSAKQAASGKSASLAKAANYAVELGTDGSTNSTPVWDSRYVDDPSSAPTPPPSLQSGNEGTAESEEYGEMGGLVQGGATQSLHAAVSDLWAHAQHAQQSQILKQQQQHAAAAAEARRMMQQHQQHQQQVMNLSSIMPWLTPGQLAQAAALQQQQQEGGAFPRDWVDAAQMHLLRQQQGGHHHFSMAPGSQLRNIAAMANFAAMNNPGSLTGSALSQMEGSSSAAPASLHDAERLETLRQLHGFGGGSGTTGDSLSNYRGQSGPSSTGSNSSSASNNPASALGLLARAIPRSEGSGGNNNNGYSMDGSSRNSDGNDGY